MMMKKSFVFLFLSVMLFSLIAGVVSAQTSQFTQTINDFLRPWEDGSFKDLVLVKYLVLILVWMVVWSILGHFPGLKNLFKGDGTAENRGFPILGAIFSFIIAFLALAYITPSELEGIMASYAGLGFTIGALLPAIIIMAWTFDIASTNAGESDVRKKVSSNVLVILIWTLFGVFTLFKLSKVLFGAESSTNAFIWGSVAIVVLCGIMVFGGIRWVNRKMSGMITKERFDSYRNVTRSRIAALKAAQKEVTESGRTTKDEF